MFIKIEYLDICTIINTDHIIYITRNDTKIDLYLSEGKLVTNLCSTQEKAKEMMNKINEVLLF
jgi:hypothetical protein